MSLQNVSLAVEVPDCGTCGKQIPVGQVYYKSATQHMKMVACVPSGCSQGKLLKALPDAVTVYCKDCVPSGIWQELEGKKSGDTTAWRDL